VPPLISYRGISGGGCFKPGSDGLVSAAVTTGVLWQIAYAPYGSDYSRYMSPDKGVRAVFWYSYSGVVLGSAAPMMIGALVGLVSTSSDRLRR
jgi:purine-cytosine permease-like protein